MTKLYPSLSAAHLEAVTPALCKEKIKLPSAVESLIKKIVLEFVQFKKQTSSAPWSESVLNSLDFHYSSDRLKIIEANTNASGYLLSNLLLEDKEFALNYEKTLFDSFKKVFATPDFKKISIIDKQPEKEKMYPEFLMFKDFFNRHGVECLILKTKDVTRDHKFIYNRDTDFYLEENLNLREAWESGATKLSTSPHSYENIADKKNDISLNQNELIEQDGFSNLKAASLETRQVTENNKDDLWTERKKLFFKPSSSFGSKGVYAGKSISRKKFDDLEGPYLAQELHPPGKVKIEGEDWKFDIRAFFSEGPATKIIARVYKGQLTNFSHDGGGFALIEWVD